MTQSERIKSTTNRWEADPWDVADSIADLQLAGFAERARKPICWTSITRVNTMVFGIEVQKLIGADVVCFAKYDGEDMLLMQLAWHGFPDPPEWRLASRGTGSDDPWVSWGYFVYIPDAWRLPSDVR